MITETVPLWADLLASFLLISGSLLTLIGSASLLRLPNFPARIHGPTLGNTLGLGSVLLASMLVASIHADRLVFQEVLITLFMVTTSPVTAILLMRSGINRKRADTGKTVPRQDAN